MQNYKRMYLASPEVPTTEYNSPLLTNSVYKHIQVWSMQSSVVTCIFGSKTRHWTALCRTTDDSSLHASSCMLQSILSDRTAVLAETGDSWFNCQKLKLPTGCG